MNSKTLYAILLLLSALVGFCYSVKSCSSSLDCKYGRCENGVCMCSWKIRNFEEHVSSYVCTGRHKKPVPRIIALQQACGEARNNAAEVHSIFQPKVKVGKKLKSCKNLQYTAGMNELCSDQSYCSYKGVCIMEKYEDGTLKSKYCLCDKHSTGQRCNLMASHGGHPTSTTTSKPTIGLIILIAAFGVICVGTVLLIVQRCRRTAGHTSLDEVGTEDGSIASEKENSRSSHVLGESAPLWK